MTQHVVPFFDSPTTMKGSYSRWHALARKFLQCLFLSFPRAVLYASILILQRAQEGLVAKANRLKDEAGDADKEKLGRIIKLVGEIKFIRKHDHHDHWHANYNPHALGSSTV